MNYHSPCRCHTSDDTGIMALILYSPISPDDMHSKTPNLQMLCIGIQKITKPLFRIEETIPTLVEFISNEIKK